MTQLEKLEQVFKELNIGYDKKHDYNIPGDVVLILNAKHNKNVEGYIGFTAEFSFDWDENFTVVSLYE